MAICVTFANIFLASHFFAFQVQLLLSVNDFMAELSLSFFLFPFPFLFCVWRKPDRKSFSDRHRVRIKNSQRSAWTRAVQLNSADCFMFAIFFVLYCTVFINKTFVGNTFGRRLLRWNKIKHLLLSQQGQQQLKKRHKMKVFLCVRECKSVAVQVRSGSRCCLPKRWRHEKSRAKAKKSTVNSCSRATGKNARQTDTQRHKPSFSVCQCARALLVNVAN